MKAWLGLRVVVMVRVRVGGLIVMVKVSIGGLVVIVRVRSQIMLIRESPHR